MSEALEKILRIYGTIKNGTSNVEESLTGYSQMFSGGTPGHWAGCSCPRCSIADQHAFGTETDFQGGSKGNIEKNYNFGEMTGDSDLNPYELSERYDFSSHNKSDPHLNQDVTGINSGSSNKTQNNWGAPITDEYKGVGGIHHIKLPWEK